MNKRIIYTIEDIINKLNLLKSKGFEDCNIAYIPVDDSLQVIGVDDDTSVNITYMIKSKYKED